jgi:cytochrome c553
MMRPLPIAASLALLFTAFTVSAQETPAPAATPAVPTAAAAPAAAAPTTGDASRGKGLVYTCKGCHGLTGYKNAYPSYHVPMIGGQSETYLRNALTEYRTGKRKHPTMQAQAESFSEQDIADIAAYLSSLKK